jgi:hypothetical protein
VTRKEAKALAWKLRKEGKDLAAITKVLADKGYVGKFTGKPISSSGVYRLMGSFGVKKKRAGRPSGRARRASQLKAAATRRKRKAGGLSYAVLPAAPVAAQALDSDAGRVVFVMGTPAQVRELIGGVL